ncbi:hypothetical protein M3205_22650 [Cytobacillus firmus]|uniref:hypothetical protein n=1 Tax=Cytobacillus firmus TaxID=1399 RepID=UPI00203AA848|nr:hypothetical protein [Cytobacillus firmus]MCM3708459.1 hypothetical protein [Cytobacillus firmus]
MAAGYESDAIFEHGFWVIMHAYTWFIIIKGKDSIEQANYYKQTFDQLLGKTLKSNFKTAIFGSFLYLLHESLFFRVKEY